MNDREFSFYFTKLGATPCTYAERQENASALPYFCLGLLENTKQLVSLLEEENKTGGWKILFVVFILTWYTIHDRPTSTSIVRGNWQTSC